MIEEKIIAYLKSILGIPVYASKPEKVPNKYVLVRKTGSGSQDYITSAMVAIQSYDESEYKAGLLNEEVKKAMFEPDIQDISSCKLNSDYPYTDTKTKEYRYQAIYDITHY